MVLTEVKFVSKGLLLSENGEYFFLSGELVKDTKGSVYLVEERDAFGYPSMIRAIE